jgi:hypothetical protein
MSWDDLYRMRVRVDANRRKIARASIGGSLDFGGGNDFLNLNGEILPLHYFGESGENIEDKGDYIPDYQI